MDVSAYFRWWQNRAAALKADAAAMAYALRHPGTPWYARVFLILVVAYVLSPIDLIPDFLPVVGYLDDLLLIPLGLLLTRKMIPAQVWNECQQAARTAVIPRSLYWLGIAMIVSAWAVSAYILFRWLG